MFNLQKVAKEKEYYYIQIGRKVHKIKPQGDGRYLILKN